MVSGQIEWHMRDLRTAVKEKEGKAERERGEIEALSLHTGCSDIFHVVLKVG